jgi:hypothetical protein
VKRLLGALAIVALALALASPPAAARCWRHAGQWHCWPHHYRHHVWRYEPSLYPEVFRPGYYPYAYYPAPANYQPYNTYYCYPIWPFCLL